MIEPVWTVGDRVVWYVVARCDPGSLSCDLPEMIPEAAEDPLVLCREVSADSISLGKADPEEAERFLSLMLWARCGES